MTVAVAPFIAALERLDGKPYFWGNPTVSGGEQADSQYYGGNLNPFSLTTKDAASSYTIQGADCSGVPFYGLVQAGWDGGYRPGATRLSQESDYLSEEDALKTEGALLFFKKPDGKIFHVEVSVGDGDNAIGARTGKAGIRKRSWVSLSQGWAKKNNYEAFGGWFRGLVKQGEQPTSEPLAPSTAPSAYEQVSGWPLWLYGVVGVGIGSLAFVGYQIYQRRKGR